MEELPPWGRGGATPGSRSQAGRPAACMTCSFTLRAVSAAHWRDLGNSTRLRDTQPGALEIELPDTQFFMK